MYIYFIHLGIAKSSSSLLTSQNIDWLILHKLRGLSERLKRDLVILIDVGAWVEQYQRHTERIKNVITSCNTSRFVISMSSGNGFYNITSTYVKFSRIISSYTRCRLLNFSPKDVKLYIKEKGCKGNSQKILNTTNGNPYLVSVFTSHASVEDDYEPLALEFMLKHVKSILTDMKTMDTMRSFCVNEFREFYTWGCRAENQISSNISMLKQFTCSWGAVENFFFYRKINDNKEFQVHCALPCLHLLLNEIVKVIEQDTTIPRIPIIQGFIYEAEFFKTMMTQRNLTVNTKTETKTCQVHCVLDTNNIEKMTCGVLYHLRYTYPVIDGVGFFHIEGRKKSSLVFIQVSLSKYSRHETKLSDLLTKKAPECSGKCILQHYRDLCPSGLCTKKALYVYISPHPYPAKKEYSISCVEFSSCVFNM